MKSGIALNRRYTGVPQTGQKPWIFTLPLSAVSSHSVA